MGLRLGHFGQHVVQGVERGRDRVRAGQLRIGVAFLRWLEDAGRRYTQASNAVALQNPWQNTILLQVGATPSAGTVGALTVVASAATCGHDATRYPGHMCRGEGGDEGGSSDRGTAEPAGMLVTIVHRETEAPRASGAAAMQRPALSTNNI